MIHNESIICFGFAEWDNPYRTNQHHLMERLSADNTVLFIESLGLRQPTFQKKDVTRIIKRLFKWFRGVRRIDPRLYVYAPLVLPFHKFAAIRRFNTWFLARQLDSVIRKLGFDNPIIWTYIPNAVEYFGRWKEKLSVYHCVDDISANPLVPKEAFQELESRLLGKVNLVFCTSKALFEDKKRHNKNTFYLPNVADFEHFNKAAPSSLSSPMKGEEKIAKEIVSIPSPRIGFIGAISSYKLDLDLVSYIAARHPEWSIVMIGAIGEGEKGADIGHIESQKNIYLLGGRSYSVLPSYLKGFDVCLLPNSLNDYTKNMFPMKFFEYLSSGKPIVSTDLNSLHEFKDFFYISKNREEFEQNIIRALKENSSELVPRRIELAKKFTWENRIEEMSRIIEAELKVRQ